MANEIVFSVASDGSVSPSVVHKAGVQGSHNVTEVKFDVSALSSLYADGKAKTRIQIIDGAGGFYSTGFLKLSEDNKVSCEIPSTVTNVGGIANVHLVVTKITYENELAVEDQAFISFAGKISFEGSGVGSPSEYQYRKGISSALVNAEIFVGQAERFASEAKESEDAASGFAANAATSAEEARQHKEDVQTDLTNYVTKEDANNTYATKEELDTINVNEVIGNFTVTSEDGGESVEISAGVVKGNQGGGTYKIGPDEIILNGFLGYFEFGTEGVIKGNDTAKASWQEWLGIQSMIDTAIGQALEGDY